LGISNTGRQDAKETSKRPDDCRTAQAVVWSRSKNEPGAAGNREQPHDSHTDVSTCPTACYTRAESSIAACSEAGSENCLEARAPTPGYVPFVQGRMGRDCREDSERAGDSLCVSFLPVVAPRFRTGARFP